MYYDSSLVPRPLILQVSVLTAFISYSSYLAYTLYMLYQMSPTWRLSSRFNLRFCGEIFKLGNCMIVLWSI